MQNKVYIIYIKQISISIQKNTTFYAGNYIDINTLIKNVRPM